MASTLTQFIKMGALALMLILQQGCLSGDHSESDRLDVSIDVEAGKHMKIINAKAFKDSETNEVCVKGTIVLVSGNPYSDTVANITLVAEDENGNEVHQQKSKSKYSLREQVKERTSFDISLPKDVKFKSLTLRIDEK